MHTLTFTTNSGANSNVRVKIQTKSGGNTTFKVDDIRVYFAQLLSHTECESADAYRFGFKGKDKVDEVYGEGSLYDYGFRIYDSRIARFLSVDPLTQEYPWYTPYQFGSNNPVMNIDVDGLEGQANTGGPTVTDPPTYPAPTQQPSAESTKWAETQIRKVT